MSHPTFPPPGACDCHVHVIGPKERFPLAPRRTYTPRDALTAELGAMLARLRLDRVVLVQPSIYATDNACMMDAVASFGDRARAVAVLAPDTPVTALDALHRAGVRGLRVNVASVASLAVEEVAADLDAAARLAARNGWHVQTFLPSAAIGPLSAAFLALPAPVVIDHFGLVDPAAPPAAAEPLMRLLDSGQVWVKLSGTYRISDDMSHAGIAPLARRLAGANPDRVVWGSDWPHTPAHGHAHVESNEELAYRDLDTRSLLDAVRGWFPDPASQRKLLVDNPSKLYDFA